MMLAEIFNHSQVYGYLPLLPVPGLVLWKVKRSSFKQHLPNEESNVIECGHVHHRTDLQIAQLKFDLDLD